VAGTAYFIIVIFQPFKADLVVDRFLDLDDPGNFLPWHRIARIGVENPSSATA
jgi:hypothetical protein